MAAVFRAAGNCYRTMDKQGRAEIRKEAKALLRNETDLAKAEASRARAAYHELATALGGSPWEDLAELKRLATLVRNLDVSSIDKQAMLAAERYEKRARDIRSVVRRHDVERE